MHLLDTLLNSLSPAEKKRAIDWVQRPDLVNYLENYPNATGDRQVRTQLLRRLEDFLVWEQLRRTKTQKTTLLLDAYRERGLQDLLRTRVHRQQTDDNAGLEEFQFAETLVRHQFALETKNSRDKAKLQESFRTAGEAYRLAYALRHASEQLSYQRTLPEEARKSVPRLAAVLRDAEQLPYRAQPGIRLFYLAVKLETASTHEAPEIFRELTEGIVAYGLRFPEMEATNLLLLAINYGLRSANAGDTGAVRTTFELYRLGIERETLLPAGRISRFTFNNVLALALRLDELDWATAFLGEHQHRLAGAGSEEVIALGLARLAFARNDDGAALRHIQQSDFQDFIHHLTARVIQLKIYSRHPDDFTLLDSHVNSTLKLLSRKRYAGSHRDNYRNIFKLARAVTRLEPSAKARKKLAKKIENTAPCTEKAWLLEQL